MRRWVLGTLAFLLLAGSAAGVWYYGFREKPRKVPEKSAEYFLPEDPSILIQINHTRKALRNLSDVGLVRTFNRSRFNETLKKRIVPLLSLFSDQFKANTPYPSQQLLRSFRDTVSYVYKPRHGSPVFLFTPSEKSGRSPTKLRTLIEDWILSPARNRKHWSVTRRSFRNTPFWRIKYTIPTNGRSITFSLTTVSNHGLISRSETTLKESIQRYYDNRRPTYRLKPPSEETIVDFLVTQKAPEGGSSLLEENDGPIPAGSARRLQGTVTVQKPYLKLTARALLPDTIPVSNQPLQPEVLQFFPANSHAINVLSVPRFDARETKKYRSFLKQGGRSLLPDRTEVTSLIDALESLRLLQHQRMVGFASYRNDVEGSGRPETTFLVVLEPLNKKRVEDALDRFRSNSPAKDLSEGMTLTFGPLTTHAAWQDDYLLVAPTRTGLKNALKRRRNRNGFGSHSNFEAVRSRVPDRFTSFSYFSTAPLAQALKESKPPTNPQYQLGKAFIGYDPIQEVGHLVEDLPANLLITRIEPGTNNVTLRFYTAGDLFLPMALRKLDPETRFFENDLPEELNLRTGSGSP